MDAVGNVRVLFLGKRRKEKDGHCGEEVQTSEKRTALAEKVQELENVPTEYRPVLAQPNIIATFLPTLLPFIHPDHYLSTILSIQSSNHFHATIHLSTSVPHT